MGVDKFGRYLNTENSSSFIVNSGVSKQYIEDCLKDSRDSIIAYQKKINEVEREYIVKLIKDLEQAVEEIELKLSKTKKLN